MPMTLAAYDQTLRAAAASTGTVVPLLDHVPVAAATRPVAVTATRNGQSVTVTAADPDTCPQTTTGPDALALLADLGVTLAADQWATLVCDDPGTLAALSHLARSARTGNPHEATAAHIAWWVDRAGFPGGHAITDVPAACRLRWITATNPEEEQHPAIWRSALGVSAEGLPGLLDLHRRLTDGPPLRWLDTMAQDAQWSYEAAQRALANGWDWRLPDTPGRAALGLRGRCDSADLYGAALLTDPRYRARSACSGHVVTGIVTGHPQARRITMVCERLDSRLRPGSEVTGWEGTAATVATDTFGAVVSGAMVQDGDLVLTLSVTSQQPPVDAVVTLIPAAPVPARQGSARGAYRRLYSARRSWLSTGRIPTTSRRPVPLDVLVAGADSD